MAARTILALLILLLAGPSSYAQWGIQGQRLFPALAGETAVQPLPRIDRAWSAGLVYAIRRSDIRMEWLPGIAYWQTTADVSTQARQGQGVIATLDWRVYPMDLYGDCMCPTFSRKGAVFQKGFFWEAGVGGYYLSQALEEGKHSGGHALVRAGLGLDLGISRYWTITPGVRMQYLHDLHAWADTATGRRHRPLWVVPFLQAMYFLDR